MDASRTTRFIFKSRILKTELPPEGTGLTIAIWRKTMSKAVYRGVAYDTDNVKKEYEAWYAQTHSPSHPTNTYRGVDYRPCKNVEVSK